MERYPTLAELAEHVRHLHHRAPDKVEVRPLGASAQGRPIDLISIGEGAFSALLVGTPHPNEPVGCVAMIELMNRLVDDEAFAHDTGFRWHFILSIDPDGVALNEGWLAEPLSYDRYLADFFRPAFTEQPDYTFPFRLGAHHFTASTPENLCWQAAFELTRPDLNISLHNAEVGGAFFILTEGLAGAANALVADVVAVGMQINEVGEALYPVIAPGVFLNDGLAAIATRLQASGGFQWEAGSSSADFSRERYATQTLIPEVPMWRDPRGNDDRPSGLTLAAVAERALPASQACGDFLRRVLETFAPMAETAQERAILSAIGDHGTMVAPDDEDAYRVELPFRELASAEMIYHCSDIRAVAMARRLLAFIGARGERDVIRAFADEAAALFEQLVRAWPALGTFEPLPPALPAAIQLRAILQTADFLRRTTTPLSSRPR